MVSRELLTSEGTVNVLSHLGNNDELTVGQVAESDTVSVSESTVRKRLNALENEGYVEVGAKLVDTDNTGDRRTKKVYSLTTDGRELQDTLDNVVE